MKSVVIIGAGQLGSRHLQGVAKINADIAVYVVDPNSDSLAVAKERYQEVMPAASQIIHCIDTIDKLPDILDVVIVATNADVRADVIKKLLSKTVSYLILEKVLFQDSDSYSEIETLLKKTNTACWVNHPRRLFPFYQDLKKQLAGEKTIHYTLEGGNWGLGCNGLHFLDHLSFLGDSTDLQIETLDINNIYTSKRAGFLDFNGMLYGKIGPHKFSLSCTQNDQPCFLVIRSDNVVAWIDEASGYARIAEKNDVWKWHVHDKKIAYFQSELSGGIVERLLSEGKCFLPTYSEAKMLHLPFLKATLAEINRQTETQYIRCPIT